MFVCMCVYVCMYVLCMYVCMYVSVTPQHGGQYRIYITEGQRTEDGVNPVSTNRSGATDLHYGSRL